MTPLSLSSSLHFRSVDDNDAASPFAARTSHISTPLSSGSSASSRARASRAASAARRAALSEGARRHDGGDGGEDGEEEGPAPEESLLSAAIPSTVGTLSRGTSTTLFLVPPASTSDG